MNSHQQLIGVSMIRCPRLGRLLCPRRFVARSCRVRIRPLTLWACLCATQPGSRQKARIFGAVEGKKLPRERPFITTKPRRRMPAPMYPAASRFDAVGGGAEASGSVLITSRTGGSLGFSSNQSVTGISPPLGGSESPGRRSVGGPSRPPVPKVWGHPTRQDSARDLSATLSVAPNAKELLGVGGSS